MPGVIHDDHPPPTNTMRTTLAAALLFLSSLALTSAQSTAFTYNGRLNSKGVPVTGPHEMRFNLYDLNAGGNLIAGPLDLSPVDVANGLFTVRIDFGANIFTGPARWLDISVRPLGAAAFTALTPRQEVTSSPYAIRAQTAGSVGDGSVAASQLNTGGIAPKPGQFLSYSGGNLSWSDPGLAAGGIWSVSGNNAYYSAGNVGIGNTGPAAPLEVSGILRSSRIGNSGQYLQLDGGDPLSIRLTAQSIVSAEKNLIIRNLSGETTPGVNNTIQFAVGTTNAPSTKMTITKDGNVIMATGGNGGGFVSFGSPNFETGMTISGNNRADIRFDGSTLKLLASAGSGIPPWQNGIIINTSGNVGIGGSSAPIAKLEVVGQDALRLIGYQPFLTLLDDNAGYARVRIQGVGGDMVFEPESFLNGSDGNAYAKLFNSGNFSVKTLTIRGGADLAEPFELSAADIVKGSVLIIDEENPGKLKLSSHAYDTRVAGIVSGANGVNPGISLHQNGVLEGGQNVALSGRLYVLADTTNGAIKPGDLLTTSDTPGHAMKASDHTKAQGAILGKAMSALKDGKGMVLVLVSLQ
jgi:hypothetical protein